MGVYLLEVCMLGFYIAKNERQQEENAAFLKANILKALRVCIKAIKTQVRQHFCRKILNEVDTLESRRG